MRAKNQFAILLIILTGALLTACQKKRAVETLYAAGMTHSNAPVKYALDKKDLGILPLSDHISTTVTIGKNRECTFTPTLLKSGNLQIILAMTTTGSNGKPLGMNVARVVAKPGEPFDVSIGDMNLSFTPQLTSQ